VNLVGKLVKITNYGSVTRTIVIDIAVLWAIVSKRFFYFLYNTTYGKDQGNPLCKSRTTGSKDSPLDILRLVAFI
jgi:hypothetical protein